MSRELIEHALKRHAGDPEHAKKVSEHFEQQPDLYSYCPHCKTKLTGPLQELLTHVEACIVDLLGEDHG